MKETNPTKVTRFEVKCLDGQWRKVSGMSHKGDEMTGSRVCAASENGRAFEAYGQLAADSNLAEFSLVAHPCEVRAI